MDDSKTTPAYAVLARITWMMIGPLAIAMAAYRVWSSGGGWVTATNQAYFIALAITLLGRVLEFCGGNPQRATGEPATSSDLRTYIAGVIVVGLLLWLTVNVLGTYAL